jgi:predicted nucleic-acid-binding protein
MKMIADTNVLIRAVLDDDAIQSRASRVALHSAEQVVISRQVFCELVRVLRQGVKLQESEIVKAILGFQEADNVITDAAAVGAGLEAMEAGGDFTDGVIAYEGAWLGGETFVSFDRMAVAALAKTGLKTKLLE